MLVESSIWYEHSPLIKNHLTKHPHYVLIVSPYLISMFLLQIPVAFLIDEYGPRRIISIVMLISAIGMILLGLSIHMPGISWMALFIIGIGGTVTFTSSFKMIANWFAPKSFSIMAGWTLFIAFIGSAIGQKIDFFILSHFSWKTTIINYGLIAAVYALFVFLILRDEAPGVNYDMHPKIKESSFKKALKKSLLSRGNWFMAISIGLIHGHRIPLIGLNVPIFTSLYGFSSKIANHINLYELCFFVIGILFFSFLARWIKRRKILISIGTILAAIFYLIPFYFPEFKTTTLFIFFSLSAFFAGSIFLIFIMIHESNIPQVTATTTGMLVLAIAFFHLMMSWISRIFLKTAGISQSFRFTIGDSWLYLTIVPVSVILGLVLLLFTQETHGKQKMK
ncbi:MFS transporter [Simkania sp.]|uniref:MFS transporter n=1 Tax=Simkania sp. TaxID=34094 RepID=UPI003B521368